MEPAKTLCTKYYLKGSCKFGESCKYLHTGLPKSHCKYYAILGSCIKGDQCSYIHQQFKPEIGVMKEEVKMPEKKTVLENTRTPFQKQGANPDEKIQFERNRSEWKDYPIIQLSCAQPSETEKDVAQVLRRYQHSFIRTDVLLRYSEFQNRHTPSCTKEELPFDLNSESLELRIEANKATEIIEFSVLNKINDKVRVKLSSFLDQLSQKLGRPFIFNTLKYMDNNFPSLCQAAQNKAYQKPEEVKEPPPPELASGAPIESESEESSDDEEEIEEDFKEEEKTTGTTSEEQSAVDIYRLANKVVLMTCVDEFRGISLANVCYMVIQTVCVQCKNEMEMNLTAATTKSDTLAYSGVCSKCKSIIAAAFKFSYLHINNKKDLGFIGLINVEIKDVLPCNFKAQCSSCEHMLKLQGVQASISKHTTCPNCSKVIQFQIKNYNVIKSTWDGDDKNFMSSKLKSSAHSNIKKDRKQKLRTGQPLPDYGTCKHYRKSYRWFRFPCCGKAYPCDKCHDDEEDHESEKARSINCGYCSTEQAASNTSCSCGRALIKDAKGKAFWEGGKGCRDKVKMSRKDPKKYKRTAEERRPKKQIHLF